MLAKVRVERLGGDEVLREIGGDAGDAGGNGRDDRRMGQVGSNELFQLRHEAVDAVRREIQPEEFDRDKPILFGLVRPKDGAERTRSDLMQNPEWTECVRRRSAGGFRVQRRNSSSGRAKPSDRNTCVLRAAPVL
jgi:hypothetical protein